MGLSPKNDSVERVNSNCKREPNPPIRDGEETCNCRTVMKIRRWAPDGCLTPKQTGLLTVVHNITLTLASIWHSAENVSCHGLGEREPTGNGTTGTVKHGS
jgi:hypothetical protein